MEHSELVGFSFGYQYVSVMVLLRADYGSPVTYKAPFLYLPLSISPQIWYPYILNALKSENNEDTNFYLNFC